MDRLGVISLELPQSEHLGDVATPSGAAGVLLGVAPDFPHEFDMPGGDVRVVTARLLWPSELDYVVAERAEGRAELVRRFAENGTHHRSSLTGKPVV